MNNVSVAGRRKKAFIDLGRLCVTDLKAKMSAAAAERVILNARKAGNPAVATAATKVTAATDLMNRLNRIMTGLKADHIQDDAGVDYAAMRRSSGFAEYSALAEDLGDGDVDLGAMSETERKAFFINLYNAMTLHVLAIQDSQAKAPKDIKGMWNAYSYRVGGQLFTLDEIEHGILRANSGHPATPKSPTFPEGDQRRTLAMSALDHRIHFALNCGARSCPPIRVYSAAKLEAQLNTAAKSFCSQEVRLTEDRKSVEMSKILMWYRADFGSDDASVISTVAGHLTDKASSDYIRANAATLKLAFKDYDWSTFAVDSK